MAEDKERIRTYWTAVLAAETKQLAALVEQGLKIVDDSGRDLTPSAIEKHEKAIAEAKRHLAALDQVWTDRRGPWEQDC